MTEFSDQPESRITQELESIIQYEQASQRQRFVNWLVDNLLMRFGLSYVTGILAAHLLNIIAPEYLMKLAYEENKFDILLVSYIIGIINYLIYYTICEKAFRGYTLGKLISGTRAIRQDGTELTFRDSLLRTLSRLVPFEAFSGFGTPWHDSWTKTTVVKTR